MAFVPIVVAQPILPDLWLHAATIDRLRRDFFTPQDPMVDVPGRGNPYFSPYMVFWAAIGLITQLGTFTLLKISSFINLAVLLIGIGLFTRSQSRRPAAAVWALAALLVLWGLTFQYWSGFVTLPTLVVGTAYPSTFAVGLALIVWAQVLALLRGPDGGEYWWTRWLLIAVLAWLILLTHQFTALGAAIACLFFLIDERRRVTRQKLLGAGLVVLVVTVLALAWPWFSVFTSGSGADVFNELHEQLYEDWPARYGLLLVTGLPVMIHRLRRNRTDPLALTALVCTAVTIIGSASGQYFLSRALPTAAIMVQIAVGVVIASWLGNLAVDRWRRLWAAVCVLALVLGGLGQSGVINLLAPGRYPEALDERFDSRTPSGKETWLVGTLQPGDVVMTQTWDVMVMIPAFGYSTVRPAWPDPFLRHRAEARKHDTETFFDPDSSDAQRRTIAERYDIDWVLVDSTDFTAVRDLPELDLVDRRTDHQDPDRPERYLLRYTR